MIGVALAVDQRAPSTLGRAASSSAARRARRGSPGRLGGSNVCPPSLGIPPALDRRRGGRRRRAWRREVVESRRPSGRRRRKERTDLGDRRRRDPGGDRVDDHVDPQSWAVAAHVGEPGPDDVGGEHAQRRRRQHPAQDVHGERSGLRRERGGDAEVPQEVVLEGGELGVGEHLGVDALVGVGLGERPVYVPASRTTVRTTRTPPSSARPSATAQAASIDQANRAPAGARGLDATVTGGGSVRSRGLQLDRRVRSERDRRQEHEQPAARTRCTRRCARVGRPASGRCAGDVDVGERMPRAVLGEERARRGPRRRPGGVPLYRDRPSAS